MENISNTVLWDCALKDVLKVLNNLLKDSGVSTLLVLNNNDQLVGTITDGDIRRAIIAGVSLDSEISSVMKRNFSFLKKDKFTLEDISQIRNKKIDLLPILNENKNIVKVINLNKIKTILPLSAIIMAGGEGKRLKPLTENTPKPLLTIGDKPIMEHNIDRLIYFGISEIFISINYLAEQIKTYFGDGSSKGVNIKYIKEQKPLGTIGSVSLLDNIESEFLLISNSDLLTNIDYEDMFKAFLDKDADLIVATTPYIVNVPFGIMEISSGDEILGLKEKPTYTYYSNAGIYIIKKKYLYLMPKNTFWNATDLIETMISKQLNVRNYQILSYWLDIGNMNDYIKAKEDVKHISFT